MQAPAIPAAPPIDIADEHVEQEVRCPLALHEIHEALGRDQLATRNAARCRCVHRAVVQLAGCRKYAATSSRRMHQTSTNGSRLRRTNKVTETTVATP